MTWLIVFSLLVGCSFILEEAANPESAKESVRYPRPDDFASQYCLAPSYAEKKVYISWPIPKSESLSAIESTFGKTLSQSKRQHDIVQCPIGKDEQSILSMREHAISFNHDRGYTIIMQNWKRCR